MLAKWQGGTSLAMLNPQCARELVGMGRALMEPQEEQPWQSGSVQERFLPQSLNLQQLFLLLYSLLLVEDLMEGRGL